MSSTQISPEQAHKWLESMLLMRRFEEKCAQLYGQQKIKGFCHLYIGQEAVVTGTYSAITPEDSVITAYRDHGHALACGLSPESIMAELYGKATGCSKGKGGSMHLFSKEHRFFGGHGIVGGQVPLGAGIAFAEKYLGTGKVNICFMGDGAVRQGALHETFNMAMLWNLPVVFVIENNGYAMGTSVERTTNVLDLYQIGLSYQMPSEAVDGMNVVTVHNAMTKAVAKARNGEGPTLLEIRTYRYRGHSMSDPAKYRTKEEVEAYRNQDPIEQLKSWMLENNHLTDKTYVALEEKIEAMVTASVQFAEESPWPEEIEMYRDVYVQEDYPYIMD
ncbi:MAG: pyruvate dehydrogenase (acetyl-transferring) E1 component subunit alpha [Sphingomonadales bacterium]|nr:pyruvate dehydrogenase (acetyl-transferring) E1 component subunit alpha [Sphingomonadales bacterium]